MKSIAYYNEIDPFAAAWLRNLIAVDLIAPGDVDERSIADVRPSDVAGYRQCHWFAGVGGWSLAARLAGWPDSRELWTGSAPCQPYSVAGKGLGDADPRNLWPHYFRLIEACRPTVCMGEQVAAAVGKGWLDRVFADLEGIDYACGAAIVPCCAVNAPHRRDRLWFVADRDSGAGGQGCALNSGGNSGSGAESRPRFGGSGASGDGDVADADPTQRRASLAGWHESHGQAPGWHESNSDVAERCEGALSDADITGSLPAAHAAIHRDEESARSRNVELERHRAAWHDCDWIIGHDGKARRIPVAESGLCLLVDGISPWLAGRSTSSQTASRQVALKGFGNAIVPEVAAEIIAAYMDCMPTEEIAA